MEPVSQDDIRLELERVLASGGFARNERLSQFLRFLVERHLEGRDSELKESVLAVEVFGRKPGYDPKLDAIVRTEAIRLRARLDKYYEGEGSQDRVIIELPKGGYRPIFRERTPVAAEPKAPSVAVEAAPPAAPVTRRAFGTRTWWMAGAIALLLVTTAAVWWWTEATGRSVTVAVLPLENLSKDAETDYFADGLTDEIIRNLSVIDGMTVRSRTSSFALKDKGLNAVDAGKQLDVDYLVEGSVLQAGDQLRINVALVGARDGSHMWSERYDRRLTDIFAIQDEISRGIVNTLRLNLSGRRRYEANLEAYDLYLRGRQIMAGFPARNRPVASRALEYFDRAIEKDPNYAIAYAGIADACIAVERNMGPRNQINAWPRARAAAARALELDPMLSEAHSAMAAIRAREYAWQDAERGFRRAIELNPNNALAHLELGARVLVVQGRFGEGLEEVRRALALDPLSPYVTTEAGEALMLAGRYPEALEQLEKAIKLDPSRTKPYNLMTRTLYFQGKFAEAKTVHDESVKRGAVTGAVGLMACIEVAVGRREQAIVLLQEQLDMGVASGNVAKTYACLGEEEQFLAALEKAVADNEPGLPELLQSPELASQRPNLRFAALRKKLNLSP